MDTDNTTTQPETGFTPEQKAEMRRITSDAIASALLKPAPTERTEIPRSELQQWASTHSEADRNRFWQKLVDGTAKIVEG